MKRENHNRGMGLWDQSCWAAGLGLALLLLSACSKPEDKPETEAPKSLAVTAVTVGEKAMANNLRLSGSIAPWEEVRLGVELSGYRVQSVLVETGAIVKRGDVLLKLDARLLDMERAQAEAQLAQAKANMELAVANGKRARDMLAKKVISTQQAEEWMAGEKTTAAAVQVAAAAVDAARLRQDFAVLRAPHDGVIAVRSVDPGQVVNPGDVLMTLVRDGRLEWRAEVTEANLLAINPGQTISLKCPDGSDVTGTVRTRSPGLDARTRTGLVYADLPDPKGLRAGMFAEGAITLGETASLRVPSGALLLRDGFAYVYVIDQDSKARERRVELGDRQQGWVEIRTGLTAGERIVSKGAAFIGDGDAVRVVEGTAS